MSMIEAGAASGMRRTVGPDGPNFFLLGAHKSGTTALFHDLTLHPGIFTAPIKETFFFADDAEYARGMDYYETQFFSGARDYPARGEGTPKYLFEGEVVAPRIRQYLGVKKARMIVLLRDPVRRAWSHYRYAQVRRGIPACGDDFVRVIRDEIEDGLGTQMGCVWRGCYATQLETWFRHFSPEDFSIFLTSDYLDAREVTLDRLFAALDLDSPSTLRPARRRNVGGEARSLALMRLLDGRTSPMASVKALLPRPLRRRMAMAVRSLNTSRSGPKPNLPGRAEQLLRDFYRDELRRLREILGRGLEEWESASGGHG